MPVHLYGHPCDMTAIGEVARQHGVAVIEDAAQAAGASWQGRSVGAFGTGCFSFYATKNMTTGEGGMIVTDDDAIAQRARVLRSQGEAERYRTDVLSGNYRITELSAAIGLAQLPKLAAGNERRRANAAWLSAHLDGVVAPVELPGAHHVYHQYTVRVLDGRRDALRAALREQDIESVAYYERCVHQQPLYRELGIGGSFPVAERASAEVLSLPVHPALSQDDLKRVAAAVNGAPAPAGARGG
jgi:dTDP-4-amino-4,6-dideoxygalactose transaminase